jgi:uncharacterized protein YqfB (UPF0267 family)
MRERPILFSGPMVKAILGGRKTITRRVLKLQDYDGGDCYETKDGILRDILSLCPYGIPGDRLWVRETWADPCGKRLPVYRADEATAYLNVKWRPSIFMPRWASRITLEVTGVRVERLQDITEEDAQAEGVEARRSMKDGVAPVVYSYQDPFRIIWDSINGKKYPWSDNPWVWVIEFRHMGRE